MDAVLITAVNGAAAGAGFSLAVSGDLVVASSSASFTMAYTRAGLSPDGSSSYYLPRLIGVRRTQDLMLTNRKVSAAEAVDWGMVNYVVDPAELSERVDALATQIATGAKGSNSAVKKLLLATFGNTLEEQLDLEAELIGANGDGADGREGIDAFLNKRAPNFA
jgi:2-(1,2-epoxy-1,2-dihydrophenyl)acetyl-CoA isomerase